MISGFTISKNVDSQGYPYIESIKSFLPVVDEMVVVDSSTDESIKNIQKLSDKIRIIKEPWEDNWYYWRMNRNFDKGFTECGGDVIMKFDLDRVLHEDGIEELKTDFQKMLDEEYLTLVASAISVPVVNKINSDKEQILAVNMKLAKQNGMHLRFGIDEEYGLHNNVVDYKYVYNNLIYGKREYGRSLKFTGKIFNYGHCFMTESQALDLFYRIWRAPQLQEGKEPSNYEKTTEIYYNSRKNLASRIAGFEGVELEYHPKIIQEKILNMTEEQRGYNWWGKFNKPEFL